MTLHFSPYTTELKSEDDVRDPSVSGSDAYRQRYKRAFDLALILITLPVVLPLVALAAALVALDGRNPFYSQLRVGQNGRHFRIWKLRTMVHNADKMLEQYLARNPSARAEWDSTQKLKKDPRITFFGQFLRKSSMDELPQLLNVFQGTMSLVGPRPMMVSQQPLYPGQSYYQMRPGITGFWQVSDRNNCEFSDRSQYDDRYYREMSFKTDIGLLVQTVGVVVKATGH